MVIELTPEMESTLSKIAERRQLSLVEALRQILDHEGWFDEQVQQGIDQADRGELIPHEDVIKWLQTRKSAQS